MAQYDSNNAQIPETTPVALPVGYEHPETLAELIARMTRNNEYMKSFEGMETEEEANDFETEDDDIIIAGSPYEYHDMTEEFIDQEAKPDPTVESEPKEKPLEPTAASTTNSPLEVDK